MLQTPSIPVYQLPQPSYNAVKIDIHNPSVNGQCSMPQPQYEPVTAPYYNYPQYPIYPQPTYTPQQQVQQPVYAPQQPQVQQPVSYPIPPIVPVQPVPTTQQVNINAPQAPLPNPVIQEAPQQVNVEAPAVQNLSQFDLNGFLAKLTNPDLDVQASAMEEIAGIVKDQPQIATELLDSKVIEQLTNIINADLSKLAGPTQEQSELRSKLANGEKLSEEQNKFALTITPMEQANRNKIYAIYALAILDKLFGDEVSKISGKPVSLTELPAAITIVDQLKDNPHPMVRTAAIDGLSYMQSPEYKKDLTTLFTIAQNDVDPSVQEAANNALEKLKQI